MTDRDFIAGQFLWTGVDFLGECPGWPKRISQAGALDLRGKEKPLYAQRLALWTKDPVIRIAVGPGEEEHDSGAWGECFRWQGVPGEKKRVSCYTNGGAAELFLNGKSLGKKTLKETDGGRAIWVIPYEEGILEARTEGASDLLATPGKACSLKWIRNASQPGEDVIQLEAVLLDKDGRPAQDEVIRCQVLGDVEILGMENGLPDDLTPYSEHFRTTGEGTLTVYLRKGKSEGKALVYARTDSGLEAELTLRK